MPSLRRPVPPPPLGQRLSTIAKERWVANSACGGTPDRVQSHSLTIPYRRVPRMSDVTRVLCAIEQGDASAAGQLLPLVYDELRKLAAQKLAHETPGQTLEPTALVHEAYLRLVDTRQARHW